MSPDELTYLELRCARCGWTLSCGPWEMVTRLTAAGKLKRGNPPQQEILSELFRASVGGLSCDECGHVGLMAVAASDDAEGDWQQARTCEACSAPIPAERLELFPDSTLCVVCQGKEDRGESLDAPEYCPRCGSILSTRTTRGRGVTRWEVYCPACGR